MNAEERAFLQSREGLALIESNLTTDPVQFALRHSGKGIPVAAVATQLKYLARAREKLPSFFAARCLLPPRAYEQCSSEEAAALKPFVTGERALDLTCGLGVDAIGLAGHFKEVVALEADPGLAAVTAWNLPRLGATNIHLHTGTAEDFLASYDGPPFDLVFVDPDRRDEQGQRKFALADCRPDVLALRDQLLRVGRRIMLKLSPMLDLTELQRQLEPLDRITVVAVDNECKEVLVELGASDGLRIGVSCMRGGERFRYETEPRPVRLITAYPEPGDYAYEPDISLYKAGITANFWADRYPDLQGGVNHPEGYFFSEDWIGDFPGRVYEVEAVMHYQPARIRQTLAAAGYKQVNLSRRWFDIPLRQVRQQAAVREGGESYLLLTRTPARERIALLCRRHR